ncbi:outer membrane protein assembly factor BamE [Paenalcaligenes faecalis]|uniref:outer membrane protein assembly factor BamE n=1 Tax=Paenalcaligenes faecalis TaxID=2980099 RepID=UPI0022B9625D|nr:outer membrane protein assembly factor BamE [Paenalcaligenes faecalis]
MIAKKYSSLLRVGLIAGMTALTLSACSGSKWGFPYKAPIQQGNWLTTSQVERLEVGMTREQVRFLLGTPTLQDVFHSDRWEYPYYHKPGSGKEELRTFTVWFDGDLLVRWQGDVQPNRQPFEQSDSGSNSIQKPVESPANSAIPMAVEPAGSVRMDAEPLR